MAAVISSPTTTVSLSSVCAILAWPAPAINVLPVTVECSLTSQARVQQARHREKIDIKDMRKLSQPLLVEAAGAIDPGIGDDDIQPAKVLQCRLDQARPSPLPAPVTMATRPCSEFFAAAMNYPGHPASSKVCLCNCANEHSLLIIRVKFSRSTVMSWVTLSHVLAVTAGTAMALVLSLWLASIALRDVSIIDMAFSGLITILLLAAYALSDARGVIPGLIVALVLIWACRMSVYLVRRNWGHGEDPRYTRLRQWVPPGWRFHWLSLRQVFLLQGIVIWILTSPQQIAIATGGDASFGALAAAGLGLWCLGFFFETVGDHQLSRFRADPDRRGQVLDTGLWRYTRHPNYFGELCQWWGLYLIALEAPWAWCGFAGPLVYSWLVINVTGQRTLDKKMAREKPEYASYMRATSGLIPWPPRPG